MISRANSLKHGLCALTLVPEDPELVKRRSLDLHEICKPQNDLDVWMVDQAALHSIRIDQCQQSERQVRTRISVRAELTWDEDRRFEAERVSADHPPGIRRRPSKGGSDGLLKGCDWLMGQWSLLAFTADTLKGWSDDHNRLAFDLLGTPAIFRAGQKPGAACSTPREESSIPPQRPGGHGPSRDRQLARSARGVVAELDEYDQRPGRKRVYQRTRPGTPAAPSLRVEAAQPVEMVPQTGRNQNSRSLPLLHLPTGSCRRKHSRTSSSPSRSPPSRSSPNSRSPTWARFLGLLYDSTSSGEYGAEYQPPRDPLRSPREKKARKYYLIVERRREKELGKRRA